MAGINFGIAFGNAMSSGIKTYGEMQQMQQQATLFQQQQQQVAREDQERQAATDGSGGTTTAVTPGTLAAQMQGADGKADPDAVIGTYGAIQDPSQAPSQTASIVNAGIGQGQAANQAAGQGPQGITVPVSPPAGSPPAAAPVPGAGAVASAPPAVTPTNAGGAPASFDTPATPPPGNAPPGTPPSNNSVNQATQYVMGVEGGYVANDNGRGPTKYGINGQANGLTPAQVQALTPEDAVNIYKTKYFNGAGGGVDISTLPPAAATAVGDAEVNMGQATAGKLWNQSGGDLNKFLDLRQQAYNAIPGDASNKAAWNNRMSGIRDFVNQHGTSEATTPGAPPVDPAAPVQELKATPLPGNGLPDTMKFSHDSDGNVQMTKADTPADALQRMANKAFQTGDIKNGPTLQKAALDLRSQQAQASVTKIMTNTTMTPDQKVAQLASLTGMPAYKTTNGNYLMPGLGPVDANNNPMPMTAVQAGSLAQQLATPEGMQHIVESQQAMKAAADKSAVDKSTIAKNYSGAQEDAARAQQDAGVARNQDASAAATNAEKNAKAAAAQEQANISQQLQALSDQQAKLDPKSPTYASDTAHIQNQSRLLMSRQSNKPLDPNQQIEVKPGATYRNQNNQLITALTGPGQPGIEVAADQAPQITNSWNNMQANKDKYAGIGLVDDPTKPGYKTFAFDPTIAKSLGLNPNQTYPNEDAAYAARKAAVKGPTQPAAPTYVPPAATAGIPDTMNPQAY